MLYKRKLEGRTNYKKRLAYLLSRKPRLVIRKSNKIMYTQIIEYTSNGDKTLVSAMSTELAQFGYKGKIKNTPSAYLTGLLIAKKALKKSIKSVVPDIGFHSPIKGSLIFAVMKGAKDGGLDLKIDDSAVPKESRIRGEHLSFSLKSDQLDPTNLTKNFEDVKNKIIEK